MADDELDYEIQWSTTQGQKGSFPKLKSQLFHYTLSQHPFYYFRAVCLEVILFKDMCTI